MHYGGTNGPDLNEVAQHAGLTPDEVVRVHAGAEYAVYMVGFSPGFPYLGGLPGGWPCRAVIHHDSPYQPDPLALVASRPAFTRSSRPVAGASLAEPLYGCSNRNAIHPRCFSWATAFVSFLSREPSHRSAGFADYRAGPRPHGLSTARHRCRWCDGCPRNADCKPARGQPAKRSGARGYTAGSDARVPGRSSLCCGRRRSGRTAE